MGYDLFKAAVAKKKNLAIYFVCHGQSEGDTLGEHCLVCQDTGITETGETQAAALGKYFSALSQPIKTIYTSVRNRTKVTADAITAATGVTALESDRLVERDWGKYRSYTWINLSEQLSKMNFDARYTFTPPEGESWQMMEDRLFGVLTLMVEAAEPDDQLVVVTHHGCLRAILPLIDGSDRESHEDYSVEVGTITKYNGAMDKLEFINHLPPLNKS